MVEEEIAQYDHDQLARSAQLDEPSMYPEQRALYDKILADIEHGQPSMTMVLGPGGCGKTFLYSALLGKIRSTGKVALAVASSGIAALLLVNGTTAHSRFRIPVQGLGGTSMCNLPTNTMEAEFIRSAVFICWDEAPMMHRHTFEAVDRTLRDITQVDVPFGGKVVLLGGDFAQTLPIVKKGSRAQTLQACLTNSYLWKDIKVWHLAQNMRVQRVRNAGGDPTELERFATFLLSVGKGMIEMFGNEQGINDFIELPAQYCLETAETEVQRHMVAFDAAFPNFATNFQDKVWLTSRAILAPTNKVVDSLNEHASSLLPGIATEHYSADCIDDKECTLGQNYLYPVELLNRMQPTGMPPHKLILKVGMPIILLRNLSPKDGLCNGTRLICRQIHTRVLAAEIVTGAHKGKVHLIPRITLISNDPDFPVQLRRRQFPVKPAFAMTVNKSQGQTLDFVVLYLHDAVFTHG